VGVVFVFDVVLRPLSAVVLGNFTGSVAMSIVLNALSRVDEGLARSLHDSRLPKPLSVTPFVYGGRVLWGGWFVVEAGGEVRFRVSALESVGLRLLDAFDGLGGVRLFNVDASLSVSSVEVVRVDELFSPGPTKFVIEFLSPIRFARRRTMRRRRVKYDFCPSMENIARSLAEA